jgi:hypothetical protein
MTTNIVSSEDDDTILVQGFLAIFLKNLALEQFKNASAMRRSSVFELFSSHYIIKTLINQEIF